MSSFDKFQYLAIFVAGFFLNTILYIIASTQEPTITGPNIFSSLMGVYHKFAYLEPTWLSLPKFKAFLYSSLTVALFCVISLVIADLLMMMVKNYI